MSAGESPGRSVARAHLSQLIEMFGVDGCLRIDTSGEPVVGESDSAVDHDLGEPQHDEQI